MDTANLQVFVAAIAERSLSGAARRLKLTPMAVTRRIAALEREMGIRLIHRSTRAISLTSEGESFLPFAQEILDAHEAAQAVLSPSTSKAAGLLRVSAPVTLGRKIIMPLVPHLLQAHPGLRIDLGLSDALVDVVSSGVDVAIRIAPLKDSRLIARHLAHNPKHLYASPAYLAAHGAPESLKDLETHECLTFSDATHWKFAVAGEDCVVRTTSRFSSSGVDGFLAACKAGLGIARLSWWDAWDDVRSGALVRIDLPGVEPQELSVWAVYPTRRQVLPKLQVFLSAVEDALKLGAPEAR
jgi:DNA-binding transcriptional LysR family regulator